MVRSRGGVRCRMCFAVCTVAGDGGLRVSKFSAPSLNGLATRSCAAQAGVCVHSCAVMLTGVFGHGPLRRCIVSSRVLIRLVASLREDLGTTT